VEVILAQRVSVRELEEEVLIFLSGKPRDYLYDDLTHYGVVA
jgi:hypothetical protein